MEVTVKNLEEAIKFSAEYWLRSENEYVEQYHFNEILDDYNKEEFKKIYFEHTIKLFEKRMKEYWFNDGQCGIIYSTDYQTTGEFNKIVKKSNMEDYRFKYKTHLEFYTNKIIINDLNIGKKQLLCKWNN